MSSRSFFHAVRLTKGSYQATFALPLVGATISLCFGAMAQADFTYLSGVQTMSGFVAASVPGGEEAQDSYDLAAPDPRASWSPPGQNISAAAPPFADAAIHTSYASELATDRLTLQFITSDAHAYTATPFSGASRFIEDTVFDVTFHVDVPTPVAFSASLLRGSLEGWNSGTPFSLVFGPTGGSPLVSLVYPGFGPQIWMADQPLTEMVLEPGDYTVTALNHNAWQAGRQGSFWDQTTFDLQIIPAPASAVLLGLGALASIRRRR